jgi:hypothetical protein
MEHRMSIANDLAAEREAETPAPTTKRVRFVETRSLYVDLPAEEADVILNDRDITDLADDYGRFKRMAGSERPPFIGFLTAEDATGERLDDWGDPLPVDGTGREKWLWAARNEVADARYTLARARYREGNCEELDAVRAELGRLEERLRVMALAVEGLGPDCRPLDAADNAAGA